MLAWLLLKMNFTTKVQQYDDTQDLYIEIPHYILQNLDWKEGDELAWSIKGNQIILTKINDTSSTKEEPTLSDYDWYTVKEDAIKEYLESESEGKEYKDFDQQYEAYLYSFSPEAEGSWNQGNEQSKERTVSPPSNFPYFPWWPIRKETMLVYLYRTRPKVRHTIQPQVQVLPIHR